MRCLTARLPLPETTAPAALWEACGRDGGKRHGHYPPALERSSSAMRSLRGAPRTAIQCATTVRDLRRMAPHRLGARDRTAQLREAGCTLSHRRREKPVEELTFSYRMAGDFPPTINSPYVVKNLIGAGSLVVMYGESGSGKSHVAVDLAIAVSQGLPFMGQVTQQGGCLYIAGEGSHGLANRIDAARREGRIAGDIPFAIIERALQLDIERDDPKRLISTVALINSAQPVPVRLVVVDTLARCLVGDENSASDMTRFVQACDWIRTITTAAVLVVHHAGKNVERGARGHSSLRAAVDTELAVEGLTNPRTLTVSKQRDLPTLAPLGFALRPVILGQDEEGDEISACVLDAATVERRRAAPKGRNQNALLGALREHVRVTGSDLISSIDFGAIAKAQGIKQRNRLAEVRSSLEREGWLVPAAFGHRLNGDAL